MQTGGRPGGSPATFVRIRIIDPLPYGLATDNSSNRTATGALVAVLQR